MLGSGAAEYCQVIVCITTRVTPGSGVSAKLLLDPGRRIPLANLRRAVMAAAMSKAAAVRARRSGWSGQM